MKLNLVSFGPGNFDSTSRGGIAKMHINSGRFALSRPVKDITGFTTGDKVMMHQDQDNPSIWYLSKEANGFEVKTQKNGRSIAFYSLHLMQVILEAFEEEKCITFIMDEEPIKANGKTYWKFSPAGDVDAEEEIEESETETRAPESDGSKRRKTGGRKKGSKNKPKPTATASEFTHQ